MLKNTKWDNYSAFCLRIIPNGITFAIQTYTHTKIEIKTNN